MSTRKHLLLALAAMMGITLIGSMVLAWPSYRRARDLNAQADELQIKIVNSDAQQVSLENLADRVASTRRHIEQDLKMISPSSDIAGLYGKLSFPVDNENVLDQTLTAGSSFLVLPDSDATIEAMPLTVEMIAKFDSVFALLRAVESMDRLVRTTSVSLQCPRKSDPVGSPELTATVGLEAIYDPIGRHGDW